MKSIKPKDLVKGKKYFDVPYERLAIELEFSHEKEGVYYFKETTPQDCYDKTEEGLINFSGFSMWYQNEQ